MKALALFAVAILIAGCQENAVEPITVRGNEIGGSGSSHNSDQ